jgi:Protein of unknown function (DUF2958)
VFQEATMTLISNPVRATLLVNGTLTAAGKTIDPHPTVKLFTPDANATWLLTELDPADPNRAFGLCDLGLGFPELGWVLVSDLERLRGPLGLRVEVDGAFRPTKALSQYAADARTFGRVLT